MCHKNCKIQLLLESEIDYAKIAQEVSLFSDSLLAEILPGSS